MVDHNCNLLIFSIADLIPHSPNCLSRSSSSSSDLLCSFAAAPSTGRFFSIVFIPTRGKKCLQKDDHLIHIFVVTFSFTRVLGSEGQDCPDNKFHLTTFLEDDTKSNGYSSKELSWLPNIVVGLDYSSGTTAAAFAAAISKGSS
uniref:Uncharacterized protein n=1 Tax=Lactuca sativa TaxID=4236 RepID=A0A9R1XQQ7_LACSA|nr:hypothetical protein LSAT_V11C300126350 [Lactuca sativa]